MSSAIERRERIGGGRWCTKGKGARLRRLKIETTVRTRRSRGKRLARAECGAAVAAVAAVHRGKGWLLSALSKRVRGIEGGMSTTGT
jgi:hypothetical protein